MKKSDLGIVVLIGGFSILVAFILANMIFGDPSANSVKLEYLDVISGNISQPDPELFNATAINPTVEIFIGNCASNEVWEPSQGRCVAKPDATTPTENPPTNTTPTNPSSQGQGTASSD